MSSEAALDTYSQSHLAARVAERYDSELARGYAGHLWRDRERPLLDQMARDAVASGARVAVDIACGTGRILSVLEAHVDDVVGVDISPAMLEKALERVPTATLLEASVIDFEFPARAGLVTMFRFFTNADDALRLLALECVKRVLDDGGVFVSNVHLQSSSPGGALRGLRRLVHRGSYPRPYSARRHRRLLAAAGFVVDEAVPYGLAPNLGRVCGGRYVALGERVGRRLPPALQERLADSVIFSCSLRQ